MRARYIDTKMGYYVVTQGSYVVLYLMIQKYYNTYIFDSEWSEEANGLTMVFFLSCIKNFN